MILAPAEAVVSIQVKEAPDWVGKGCSITERERRLAWVQSRRALGIL